MNIVGGSLLGPPPREVDKNVEVTNTFAMEASGRQCVRLSGTGQAVQFAAQAEANTLVVRYSIPDAPAGGGIDSTISLYLDGAFVRKIPLTSKYSWLYGYPVDWQNTPGRARNFYDEARVMNLSIAPGTLVRLQVDADDSAAYYVIDLVDLEQIAPALTPPPGSRSVVSYGAVGNGIADDTIAIRNSLVGGGVVWFPPGNYLVTGNINVPPNTTIQGAGMWYTTFVGSHSTYPNENGRVRFNGAGHNTHFADFAILGKLTKREDWMANDGFSEFFGTNSTLKRVWVEHTKTGAWIANSVGMLISDCRFRNTIADGINLSKNCNSCIITNCTARGTGDDSFAIWPATYDGGGTNNYTAGYNVITRCTAQVPWFANGCGIYGAISNRVEDSLFQDIPNGAGILIAGTFPVGTNVFRGTTVVQRCDLIRCGGNDPGWRWRGALTICPDGLTINGLNVNNINISNSLSYAVQILSPGSGVLTNASMSRINVSSYAVGVPPYHPQDPWPHHTNYCDGVFGVFARNDAKGSISVSELTVNGTNMFAVQTNQYLTDCVNQANSQFAFKFLRPPPEILGMTKNGNGTFTVRYSAVPGYSYRLEATTNVTPPTWTTVAGSITNPIGATVTYTDSGAIGSPQRFYRVVSPN